MLENRVQNEISKRIEKAHNYSFNLANYKSAIGDSQITEWKETLKHIQPVGNATLDEVYKELTTGKPETNLRYLLKLDPSYALEADIAREYVNNLDSQLITSHRELNVIKEILKSGAKYPMVKLKDLLVLNENKMKPSKYPDVNYKLLGVSNEVGIFLNEKLQPEETNQSYFIVAKDEFCYNPYRINVGSIGLNTNDFDHQIISGAYIVFACKENELNPKYLDALFKSQNFLNYVNEKANGGVRMNFQFQDLEAWEIPLPSIEEQTEIITQIEKQKAIIEGAEKIEKNFEFQIPASHEKRPLSSFITDSLYGLSVKLLDEGKNPVIRMNNLDIFGRWHLNELKYTDENLSESRLLHYGDFIFNRTNSIDLVGKSGVVDFTMISSWAGYLIRLKLNEDLNPFYLRYLFATKKYRDYFKRTCKPAGGQANINAEELGAVSIDYFDRQEQDKIVKEMDLQMQILDGLRKMKSDAEKRIGRILAEVWGVEDVETIKMEKKEDERDYN
ncbi:MAG: restriction endonuclease subunit S [Bacteroidota bacterium]